MWSNKKCSVDRCAGVYLEIQLSPPWTVESSWHHVFENTTAPLLKLSPLRITYSTRQLFPPKRPNLQSHIFKNMIVSTLTDQILMKSHTRRHNGPSARSNPQGIINLYVTFSTTASVVRVPVYRSRGSGFHSQRHQIFWEVVGLERGPFSLVRITEKLLDRTVAAPV
jgi:hypothetical protein